MAAKNSSERSSSSIIWDVLPAPGPPRASEPIRNVRAQAESATVSARLLAPAGPLVTFSAMSTREPDLPLAVDADGKPVAVTPLAVTADESSRLELDRGPWADGERSWFDLDFASKPVRMAVALVAAAAAVSLGAWLVLTLLPVSPIG